MQSILSYFLLHTNTHTCTQYEHKCVSYRCTGFCNMSFHYISLNDFMGKGSNSWLKYICKNYSRELKLIVFVMASRTSGNKLITSWKQEMTCNTKYQRGFILGNLYFFWWGWGDQTILVHTERNIIVWSWRIIILYTTFLVYLEQPRATSALFAGVYFYASAPQD